MYNEDLQSTRSPSGSRSGSYADGPPSRNNARAYQTRSSITEETARDDNEYEEPNNGANESPQNDRPPPRAEDQYIAALRYRFPNRPKDDYAYSKPLGPIGMMFHSLNNFFFIFHSLVPSAPPLPATTTQPTTTTTPSAATSAPRGGPYQSTIRPNAGGTNASDTSDGRVFPRPALRRVTPDQQNNYARRMTDEAPPPPPPPLPAATYPSRTGTTGPSVRITEPDIDRNRTTPTNFNRSLGGGVGGTAARANESIFESVPSHGPVSFLGIGTFSQFEHCLRECLERERSRTGIVSEITRQDYPASTFDYGYNAVSMPSYHDLDPVRVHQFIDMPSQPTATYALDDIRQINVALSRSGISLFPYYRTSDEPYFSPIVAPRFYPNERHMTGAVVSACRVVDEDPAVLASRNGSHAVHNVWNAIRNHQPFSHMSTASFRGPYDI